MTHYFIARRGQFRCAVRCWWVVVVVIESRGASKSICFLSLLLGFPVFHRRGHLECDHVFYLPLSGFRSQLKYKSASAFPSPIPISPNTPWAEFAPRLHPILIQHRFSKLLDRNTLLFHCFWPGVCVSILPNTPPGQINFSEKLLISKG